jgi:Predicted dehydrogenases and related proteins
MTNSEAVRIGFIGYGTWGPNLVRNFARTRGCAVAAICDCDEERLHLASQQYPSARLSNNYHDITTGSKIDAVVIATPVGVHAAPALEALRSGKHVLIEKPVTTSMEDAKQLAEEAEQRDLVLLVDHTYLFSPVLGKLRKIVAGGMLGEIRRFESLRTNACCGRKDVNVLWDLAVHDLSILHYVFEEIPVALSAITPGRRSQYPEDTGYITVFFENDMIAHIAVSWLSARKTRQITIVGNRGMLCYDDMASGDKLIFHNIADTLLGEWDVNACASRAHPVCTDDVEVLSLMAAYFRDCVQTKVCSISNGGFARRITGWLEAANRSALRGGQRISLKTR